MWEIRYDEPDIEPKREWEEVRSSMCVTIWALCEQMGRNSQSTSPSSKERRRTHITSLKKGMAQKSFSWSKGWKEHASWNSGPVDKTTSGDRQISQEQWSQDHKTKESQWIEKTTAFHETGLLIREQKASWQKRCKDFENR